MKVPAVMREAYRRYMKSAEWRKVRLWAIGVSGNRCALCGLRKPDSKLQVHHLNYDRIGHEDVTDLEVLCQRCHRRIST